MVVVSASVVVQAVRPCLSSIVTWKSLRGQACLVDWWLSSSMLAGLTSKYRENCVAS